MAKIELSIKTSYLPTWGAWEGVRELIQNGRDAEIEFGGKFSVRHDAASARLFIENKNALLLAEALLLGQTSKADRGDLAGQFGEGLKLGLLALVRAGHEVVIRNGSEVWRPVIERSAAFQADVLKVDVTKGRKDERRVRVEIGGITAEMWAEFLPKFRFLSASPTGKDVLAVSAGHILLDPAMKGHIFVKGIFVGIEEDLHVGYDFHGSDVKVDRDRKMVESWDLRWRTSGMWKEAGGLAKIQKLAIEKIAELTFADAQDLRAAEDSWHVSGFSDEVREAIFSRFTVENGEQAIPVDSVGDAMELEHSGRVGVRVNKIVKAFVTPKTGTVDDAKKAAATAIEKVHSWGELTADEQNAYRYAVALLATADAEAAKLPVDIVTFRRADLQGTYAPDGRVNIARSELKSWDVCLTVLIHETCHRAGGDGHVSHGHLVEETWRKVAVVMATEERWLLGKGGKP